MIKKSLLYLSLTLFASCQSAQPSPNKSICSLSNKSICSLSQDVMQGNCHKHVPYSDFIEFRVAEQEKEIAKEKLKELLNDSHFPKDKTQRPDLIGHRWQERTESPEVSSALIARRFSAASRESQLKSLYHKPFWGLFLPTANPLRPLRDYTNSALMIASPQQDTANHYLQSYKPCHIEVIDETPELPRPLEAAKEKLKELLNYSRSRQMPLFATNLAFRKDRRTPIPIPYDELPYDNDKETYLDRNAKLNLFKAILLQFPDLIYHTWQDDNGKEHGPLPSLYAGDQGRKNQPYTYYDTQYIEFLQYALSKDTANNRKEALDALAAVKKNLFPAFDDEIAKREALAADECKKREKLQHEKNSYHDSQSSTQEYWIAKNTALRAKYAQQINDGIFERGRELAKRCDYLRDHR